MSNCSRVYRNDFKIFASRFHLYKFLTLLCYNKKKTGGFLAQLDQQLQDYRLTTAQIIYHMPDCQELLQEFIWQDYDLTPQFPNLFKFLGFWEKKIDGPLHSVYVAKKELITNGDYRFADYQTTLQ